MTFNDSQLKAINSDSKDIVVLAGPGSGKTRTLVARVQRLISIGVQPGHIIVITFTNAAADEVNSRIGSANLGYCGTLHGFMLRVIQAFGNTIGFTAPVTVLDEDDTKTFKLEVINRLNYRGSMEQFNQRLLTPVDVSKPMGTLEIAAEGYRRALIKANMVDYDSILIFGHRIIASKKNTLDWYKYLLVDEYQDSGDWDERIYDALPIENKFFVGDCDQSIYSFRGGNIQHILNRCKKSEVVYLEENYRSDMAICNAAQLLIEHNQNRVAKRTIAVSKNTGAVDYWTNIPNSGRECSAIADDIGEHNQNDCAVLCRTNYLVTHVREMLESFGVKVKRISDRPQEFPFWKKARVFASLLANPENDFIALQWLKLNHNAKEAHRMMLVAASRKQTINECHLKLPRDLPLARVPAVMADNQIFGPTVAEVSRSIDKLPAGAGIAELCVAMTTEPPVIETAPDETGVVVTTMHGAKGREWGTVYLPAFEQDVIPSKKKSVDVEEERRIAYVAFTRAKHRLVVSVCKERQTEWQNKPCAATPSQFVSEAQLS